MLAGMSPIVPLRYFSWLFWLAAIFAVSFGLFASDGVRRPVMSENVVVATQAIGGPYQFTDENYLLEVAREIERMGSNLIKFALNPRKYSSRPYRMEEVSGIDSMTDLLEKHPVYREVMDMDFRFYHLWANPGSKLAWHDGLSQLEEDALYDEFYELATYLLLEYKNSGKLFFLGHWEGDWLLKGKTDPRVDPTEARIQGFVQYLNVRQRAIQDARNKLPNNGVWVYHYTEVNQVWKGMDGSRPTLANSVLPLVDVDFVSYSAYDVIHRKNMREDLHRALDHIESNMKPRRDIIGKRVFVGEYAIKAASVQYDPEEHDRRNREVTRAILDWGCPFAIYWQFYCNEPLEDRDGYQGFWLVNDKQEKVPLYASFENYYTEVREFIADSKRRAGVAPSEDEIRAFAIRHFE